MKCSIACLILVLLLRMASLIAMNKAYFFFNLLVVNFKKTHIKLAGSWTYNDTTAQALKHVFNQDNNIWKINDNIHEIHCQF